VSTTGECCAVNENNSSRRSFLLSSGGALGAGWLALNWPALSAAAAHSHEMAAGQADRSFKILNAAQSRDVEAIASQIVPSGDTPGAREAGVVYFVDHVHAGPYAGSRDEFLAGLAAFQDDFTQRHPGAGSFADLDADAQIAHLKSVEATPFFGRMKFLTLLGLLALPSYGGNADKLGWKLAGFVDQHAWTPPFGHYDRDYPGFVPYGKEKHS
jgi:gluconate 2-dehydrogenase gamma chain